MARTKSTPRLTGTGDTSLMVLRALFDTLMVEIGPTLWMTSKGELRDFSSATYGLEQMWLLWSLTTPSPKIITERSYGSAAERMMPISITLGASWTRSVILPSLDSICKSLDQAIRNSGKTCHSIESKVKSTIIITTGQRT